MLNLTKGQKLNLTKDTGITNVEVGLGWKLTAAAAAVKRPTPVDLDAMAFLCTNTSGRAVCPAENFFVFFNQMKAVDGAIELSGDDRDGGDGINPDEVITIDFNKVNQLAPEITEISVLVNIFDGIARKHNFSLLESAFLRISKTTGEVICNYELKESFPTATSVQIGSFVKDATGNWIFDAVGIGFEKTLEEIVGVFGL